MKSMAQPHQRGTPMINSIEKVLYTGRTHTYGGRNGEINLI